MAPIIMAGLSLLPHIPTLWNSVAKLFNKETPKVISDAINLSKEVKELYVKGNITPDVQIQLENLMREHEVEMAMVSLKREELLYGDLEGIRELEMSAYKSGDLYVSRTRPMILRRLFTLVFIYSIFVPICIMVAHLVKFGPQTMDLFIGIIRWIGGLLFSTFGTAYLGYSAARTIDKRSPNAKDNDTVLGTVVRGFVGNNGENNHEN